MLEQAKRDGIEVSEIRRESHSAKQSFTRPVFIQLIEDIRCEKFNGILTWAPDRLSRNAGDLGALVDLMDLGKLAEIRTHGQTFRNSPNEKFLLMILCSQAKLENDNRSVNVKRGLRAKCEMGYRPGITPLGYINLKYEIKGEKRVVLDPKRAPVIREMFEKCAEGCSGRDLLHWINEIKGFRTKSGKKVALSAIYVMLHNPYYAGRFEFPKASGKWYTVKHQSIISRKLWKEVQEKLTVEPKSKPGTKVFDFTKMLTCGSCGSGVTAEEKFKDIIDGTVRRYVYYHCTKARNPNCEEPYIREENLVNQLVKILDKVNIDKLAVESRFTEDLIRYRGFMESVLKQSDGSFEATNVDIRDYAKHILMTGKREDKQAIMACVTTTLCLKNKTIRTKN